MTESADLLIIMVILLRATLTLQLMLLLNTTKLHLTAILLLLLTTLLLTSKCLIHFINFKPKFLTFHRLIYRSYEAPSYTTQAPKYYSAPSYYRK